MNIGNDTGRKMKNLIIDVYNSTSFILLFYYKNYVVIYSAHFLRYVLKLNGLCQKSEFFFANC